MNALIDTCIIIDYLQGREPFDKAAGEIVNLSAEKKINAFITAKSVTDVHYIHNRYVHDKAQTLEVVKQLFTLFIVVDTLADDCFQAFNSEITDYEDAVMEQTAKRMHIDCIITRNIKHYKNSVVKVFSPEEFLANFLKQQAGDDNET